MRVHELKTWAKYYDRVESGDKTFEIRKNDRDFQAGDEVILLRTDEEGNRDPDWPSLRFRVSYVFNGPGFGIEQGYCVLGLRKTYAEAV